eukprot:TRINITY_DN25415_c0_g1_i1.p1 TRINITY_DN25415_c0_g1~~TRINITY_DN25415_c0_g1_i1.p1  ORF type:complete len:311 (+),score=92.68 TRINITY_DN25415_c0_g1_i1:136-933(+)
MSLSSPFFWEKVWGDTQLSGAEKQRLYLERTVGQRGNNIEIYEEIAQISPWREREMSYIMERNQGSPQALFAQTYPEFNFSFKKVYQGYWKNLRSNHLIQKAMKYYEIKEKEEWYRLSVVQVSEMYGKSVPKANYIELLEFCFPEEEWVKEKFSSRVRKRARQRDLGRRLGKVFRGMRIVEEFVFRSGEKVFVFDFYVPELGLVVEYQGEQHYVDVLKWHPLEEQKKRDEEKRRVCGLNGLKLSYIPYWWDNSVDSLKQLLQISQ